MEDRLISFETAKLAKKNGFNELCNYHYCYGNGDSKTPEDGNVFIGGFINEELEPRKYTNSELASWKLPYGEFIAPTQSLLQKWLREIHNVDVIVTPVELKEIDKFYTWHVIPRESGLVSDRFDKYEDAMEQGLKEALLEL